MRPQQRDDRNLVRWINRRLAGKSGQQTTLTVKKSRGATQKADLGDYYLLDWFLNAIVERHVDLRCKEAEIRRDRDIRLL